MLGFFYYIILQRKQIDYTKNVKSKTKNTHWFFDFDPRYIYHVSMTTKKRYRKYPRLIIFLITIIIAIIVFYEWMHSQVIHDFLIWLGYGGTFIWWLFYSYGFTSSSATAMLLILSQKTSFGLSIITAGIWALISDILIFMLAKNALLQELTMLKEEPYIIKLRNFLKKTFWPPYKYIMPIVAWILIMTPLPTEIGITILASRKKLSMKTFIIMAYILHTIGITIILAIGKQL